MAYAKTIAVFGLLFFITPSHAGVLDIFNTKHLCLFDHYDAKGNAAYAYTRDGNPVKLTDAECDKVKAEEMAKIAANEPKPLSPQESAEMDARAAKRDAEAKARWDAHWNSLTPQQRHTETCQRLAAQMGAAIPDLGFDGDAYERRAQYQATFYSSGCATP